MQKKKLDWIQQSSSYFHFHFLNANDFAIQTYPMENVFNVISLWYKFKIAKTHLKWDRKKRKKIND